MKPELIHWLRQGKGLLVGIAGLVVSTSRKVSNEGVLPILWEISVLVGSVINIELFLTLLSYFEREPRPKASSLMGGKLDPYKILISACRIMISLIRPVWTYGALRRGFSWLGQNQRRKGQEYGVVLLLFVMNKNWNQLDLSSNGRERNPRFQYAGVCGDGVRLTKAAD